MQLLYQVVKKIIVITLLSAIIFTLLTGISYYLTLEGTSNFKLGFPWVFYYQFKLDILHHGSNPINFIIDFALIWGVTAGLYFFSKGRKNLN